MVFKMKGPSFFNKKTPLKQVKPKEGPVVPEETLDEFASRVSEESKSEREKKKLKVGKKKVDYVQHVTGVNKNPTGEKVETARKKALNN
jgi:hypothetical protein